MDLNKIPRWALVYGMLGFFSLGSLMLKGAFADLDQTKALTQKHELLMPQLVVDIQDIKRSNETFRTEYRQDQKELNQTLQRLINK